MIQKPFSPFPAPFRELPPKLPSRAPDAEKEPEAESGSVLIRSDGHAFYTLTVIGQSRDTKRYGTASSTRSRLCGNCARKKKT